jgi:hypothetical protein
MMSNHDKTQCQVQDMGVYQATDPLDRQSPQPGKYEFVVVALVFIFAGLKSDYGTFILLRLRIFWKFPEITHFLLT